MALPLPFLYESTGVETFFRDNRDPSPRSRRVFAFHRPETLAEWLRDPETLRKRLAGIAERHPLIPDALWPAQVEAIRNLEASFALDKPRALIQMATGCGKTYTAVNFVYRLIKHAKAKRVLFLVDRNNLGRQTFKEFEEFVTPDDRRKLSELYNVQHLLSNLRYNPRITSEYYDFIISDECRRSIHNLWRSVFEYFDAHLIGLTATPSKQTFGFFNQNLVMEYSRQRAVADGVNVDGEVYRIRTRMSEAGSTIERGW